MVKLSGFCIWDIKARFSQFISSGFAELVDDVSGVCLRLVRHFKEVRVRLQVGNMFVGLTTASYEGSDMGSWKIVI